MSSISQGLCTGCKSPSCTCPGKGRLGAGIMTGHTNQVYGHGFSGTKSNVVAAQGKYAAGAALIPNQGGGDGNQSAMNTYGIDIAKGQGVNGSPLKEFPKLPMNLIKERSVGNPVGKSPHYSSNAKKVGGQVGGTGRPTSNDTYSSMSGVVKLHDGDAIKEHSRVQGHSGQFASNAMSLKGGRGKKGYSHPKKGQGSRTKKGRKDFTTKKGNKYFNRRGHRQMRAQGSRKVRNPYKKSGGMGKKGYSHPKKGQGSRTKKGRKDFTTKKGNKYFNRRGHRQKRAQGSRKVRNPYQKGGSAPFPSSDNSMLSAGNPSLNVKAKPGFNTNKGYTISPDSGVGGMFANPIPIDAYRTCSTAPKL